MKKMNLLLSSLTLVSLVAFSGCEDKNSSTSLKAPISELTSTSTITDSSSSQSSIIDEEHTVTYVLNNGEPSFTRVGYHDDYIVAPGTVTKEYFELEGWYTDEACKDRRWNFNHDKVTSDITLYAKWVVDYDDWIWRLARIASKETIMLVVDHYPLATTTQPQRGVGSGVVIAKEKDLSTNKTYFYALTNNHVVTYDNGAANNQEEMVETYKTDIFIYDHYQNIYRGELIETRNTYDLALVRFENYPLTIGHWGNTANDPEVGIKIAKFAKEDPNAPAVEIGLDVSSYGSPLGQPGVCTIGNIFAEDYGTISQNPNGVSYIKDFKVIHHTADILGGNSGGPLFNVALELVGINYGSSGESDTYTTSDKFWAIPIKYVRQFLDEEIVANHSDLAFLGEL